MFDIETVKSKTVHIERTVVQKAISKEATALSLQQKKLLFFLISNIEADDTDFKKTVISISDFFTLTGIDEGGKNRKLLKKEIENFADKSFWINETEHREVLYRWIDTAVIDWEKSEIALELHKTVKKFLLGLDKKSRAIFQLGYTLQFKHKYSPDLYAFAASIKDFMIKNETMYKMPIEEAVMKFGNGTYNAYAQWKRKVLDPSIKEINEKTDLNIVMEPLCKDKTYKRKVTHVLFGVTRKVGEELSKVRVNALNLNLEKSVQQEAQEYADGYIEEYAVEKLGFSPYEYSAAQVQDAVEKFEERARKKKGEKL